MICTDGAEDGDKVGVGGVLALAGRREYFAGVAKGWIVERWKATSGRVKVIHQAELFPTVFALQIWERMLRGRRVLLFVDNEAARAELVKGATSSAASAELVTEFWSLAARAVVAVWVDRVPSRSNPADGPSRGLPVAGATRRLTGHTGLQEEEGR